MGRNMDAVEKIRRALDTRDRIAEHQDHDEFTHHVHAPVVEAVAEMTTVDAAFSPDAKPRYDQLAKALDAKEKMAKNGLRVSAEEQLWHEELEDGIEQVAK